MERNKPFVVACIPAKDEEKTISRVIVRTMEYVDKVLVCDDGSSDMTAAIAEKLGVEIIRHAKNVGYGGALGSLFRGLHGINPDIIVTLDADGQHNPDDIPKIVEPILKGEADMSIGSRFQGEGGADIPWYRKIGIRALTRLANAVSYERLTDAQSGFRAYSREAVRLLVPSEQGMGASTEILLKAKDAGLRVKEVPIKVNYNVDSPSSQNPLYHASDVALSTFKYLSIRHPLLFYGLPGAVSFATGLVFWFWTLRIFAETRGVNTNITLIALGATMIGLMMITTAIILWVVTSLVRDKMNEAYDTH